MRRSLAHSALPLASLVLIAGASAPRATVKTADVTITGTVYVDRNANGRRDAG